MRSLLAASALFLLSVVNAQTEVVITNVKVLEKEATQTGNNVTIQLKGDEGADRQVIFTGGEIVVKTWCKVSTHNVRRSSLKDSAVNLIFEIDMKAGDDKDNKRVEKIFYLDQSRTTTITQRFNFKDGIHMRVITLQFDAEIK
jgi:hypothetical protein